MTGDGVELGLLGGVGIFEKLSEAGVHDLGGAVAADGDEPFAVGGKDSTQDPVFMTADFIEFPAGCGFKGVDRIVGATDGDFAAVRGKTGAEDGVIWQLSGP